METLSARHRLTVSVPTMRSLESMLVAATPLTTAALPAFTAVVQPAAISVKVAVKVRVTVSVPTTTNLITTVSKAVPIPKFIPVYNSV